ncbi:hypothetical protein N7510_009038 [Penicillium lagena]|uniref:uncharacterized protein n=1 Tax=Penicillium lagena TaxID=94218 RepID=UPI002540774B|nr:uncharacterized protein N7510_009038 [Penicillium lagena]KAJ5606257.1 hypothetical protein N7510_009038 [Penicillium lagena]
MEPDNGLVFVNVAHPDEIHAKDTQRTIRKRVMRDIGRSRRRQKRPPALTFAWQPTSISPTLSLESSSLPVELDPRARELIHFMHAEADYQYRPFRTVWFTMSLHDHSAFRLALANAAMFLDEKHHPQTFRYDHCHEALKYYGQCVRQITDRLADPTDCTSEGVVTTILGLICHDLYVGTWDRWAYHIRGLERIFQIRGGFHGLNGNLHLFAYWFDVMGSVLQDSPPRLSGYPSPSSFPNKWRSAPFKSILSELYVHSEDLALAINRIAAVSDFVNAYCRRPRFWTQEDDLSPLSMLSPATHILLSLSRFDAADNSNCFEFVHEMTRLALLILLAGLKSAYALAAAEMGLLQSKLSRLLRGDVTDNSSFILPGLQVWSLVTAALLQTPGPERSLYVQEISRRMSAIHLADGSATIDFSRQIVWIEILGQPDTIKSLISEIDTAHSTRTKYRTPSP